MPLLSGDAGVEQTIALMRQLIDDGVKDSRINRYAIDILKQSGAPQHDDLSTARTIYTAVLNNFRFVNDPVGPGGAKETVRTARDILEIGAGDCDDFTILLCSLLGTVGLETRIITVASDPRDPTQFTHVYPEVDVYGEWLPVDAARPGAAFGLAPSRVYRKKIWATSDSSAAEQIGGLKFSLAGYTVLGDDSLSQDIAATGQSISDILLASEAQPSNIYGTVNTGAAASPFASPLVSSYGGYPGAAYPGAPFQVTSPFGTGTMTSSGMWLLLGLGLLGVALLSRK